MTGWACGGWASVGSVRWPVPVRGGVVPFRLFCFGRGRGLHWITLILLVMMSVICVAIWRNLRNLRTNITHPLLRAYLPQVRPSFKTRVRAVREVRGKTTAHCSLSA
jgi:hypothetical protein